MNQIATDDIYRDSSACCGMVGANGSPPRRGGECWRWVVVDHVPTVARVAASLTRGGPEFFSTR
jgi:hypothetical protein